MVKISACNAGDPGLIPGSGRSPWRRAWQLTPVFLPGKSHGQRSLVDYSLWLHKELETTERLTHTHTHTHTHSRPRRKSTAHGATVEWGMGGQSN